MTQEIVPRRAERRSVELTAQCRTQSGLRDKGHITDISAEGCCVITNELFVRLGARVVIRPDGMEGLTGVVRWINGNRAGVEFDQPLYPAVLDHLVARYSTGETLTISKY